MPKPSSHFYLGKALSDATQLPPQLQRGVSPFIDRFLEQQSLKASRSAPSFKDAFSKSDQKVPLSPPMRLAGSAGTWDALVVRWNNRTQDKPPPRGSPRSTRASTESGLSSNSSRSTLVPSTSPTGQRSQIASRRSISICSRAPPPKCVDGRLVNPPMSYSGYDKTWETTVVRWGLLNDSEFASVYHDTKRERSRSPK